MPEYKRKPELIVIAGPNGSGKTTVTQQFLHHEWSDGVVYINPDQVAKDIFGDWNSQKAVLDAANYCAAWRERCLNEKVSFVFETVFSAEDKIDFILRAKDAGFFIRIFFISTEHPSINAARITYRVIEGGHSVPIDKIITRYYKSILNCESIAARVDRLYVYDNSIDGQIARPLFRLSDGVLGKMYVNEVPEWARHILPDTDEIQIQDTEISD
ncbi:MAG: zeta toxin family protein [Muribaculaceae bacterium]|nr:zeta toxin family protein [Muribaculaceae bacterium]